MFCTFFFFFNSSGKLKKFPLALVVFSIHSILFSTVTITFFLCARRDHHGQHASLYSLRF